jgi:hypothetical protein
MRKKINSVLYDTESSSLIIDSESMTGLSGNLSVRLFKSQSGQLFQTISPAKGNNRPTISNWIGPNTARCWLEKYSFYRQIKEHFGISDNRLQPERQILVAEWKSPYSTTPHELMHVDRLYHHPQKGWCLKQTKESVLIPLTGTEAARLAKTLQFGGGQIQSSLPHDEMSLSEGGHSDHRSQIL